MNKMQEQHYAKHTISFAFCAGREGKRIMPGHRGYSQRQVIREYRGDAATKTFQLLFP